MLDITGSSKLYTSKYVLNHPPNPIVTHDVYVKILHLLRRAQMLLVCLSRGHVQQDTLQNSTSISPGARKRGGGGNPRLAGMVAVRVRSFRVDRQQKNWSHWGFQATTFYTGVFIGRLGKML